MRMPLRVDAEVKPFETPLDWTGSEWVVERVLVECTVSTIRGIGLLSKKGVLKGVRWILDGSRMDLRFNGIRERERERYTVDFWKWIGHCIFSFPFRVLDYITWNTFLFLLN